MARVCAFLGVDPALDAMEYTPRNVGGYDPAQVPASVYADLTRFYVPHNEKLYQMMGEELGWRKK